MTKALKTQLLVINNKPPMCDTRLQTLLIWVWIELLNTTAHFSWTKKYKTYIDNTTNNTHNLDTYIITLIDIG